MRRAGWIWVWRPMGADPNVKSTPMRPWLSSPGDSQTPRCKRIALTGKNEPSRARPHAVA